MFAIRIAAKDKQGFGYYLRDDIEAVPLAEALKISSRVAAESEAQIVRDTWDVQPTDVTVERVEHAPVPRGDTARITDFRVHLFLMPTSPTAYQSLWLTCTEDAVVTTMQAWSNALQRVIRLYAKDDAFPGMDLDLPPQWCTPDWEFKPE